jgi:hypothetical protein
MREQNPAYRLVAFFITERSLPEIGQSESIRDMPMVNCQLFTKLASFSLRLFNQLPRNAFPQLLPVSHSTDRQ